MDNNKDTPKDKEQTKETNQGTVKLTLEDYMDIFLENFGGLK